MRVPGTTKELTRAPQLLGEFDQRRIGSWAQEVPDDPNFSANTLPRHVGCSLRLVY
jgi:hypothetical protein